MNSAVLKPIETAPSYTIIPSVTNASSQFCSQNQNENSTEFMVTSTTVESVEDNNSKSTLNTTEREMVKQSSTIIPCVAHTAGSNGPQPIIAVIPPAEPSDFQTSGSAKTKIVSHQSRKTGKEKLMTSILFSYLTLDFRSKN